MRRPAARPRRVRLQHALVRLHGRVRQQGGDPQLEAMVKAARAATKNKASAEEAAQGEVWVNLLTDQFHRWQECRVRQQIRRQAGRPQAAVGYGLRDDLHLPPVAVRSFSRTTGKSKLGLDNKTGQASLRDEEQPQASL